MSQPISAAIAAGNIAEAATLAVAQARLGVLALTELIGIGGLLAGQGRPEQAIALYQLWLRHCDSPLMYAAWYNLAVLQAQTGDDQAAEQSYRNALAIRDEFTEARLGLGSLLERRRQPDAALALWREALERLDPDADHPGQAALRIQLFNHIGRLSALQRHHAQAEDALTRSLLLDPNQPQVIRHWLRLRQQQCAWPVRAALPGLDAAQLLDAASALATLDASDDPALQLAAARRQVQESVLHGAAPLSDRAGYTHRRLRVGYLSPDFRTHPLARLSAELYALHDRALVEVYGFCWSEEDASALRERIVNGMDHCVRIAGLADLQAAQLIRAHEIDILIDLHGLGAQARPDILSHRPAPVQIAWLGYPGTSAMDSIDYVLADAFALPPELAPYFTEQPLYLPHCCQIGDRQRQAGARPQRAGCGLPEAAFVFCCFSDPCHYTPQQFASWMRILQRVPDSVLWLAADGEQVRDNLRIAALRHGVASERLVFAPPLPAAEDLARYPLADLFLDTLPFNAAAEASDALWAGLPLLTRAGRSFASRMTGGLLHAAGLPELVTDNLQDYEDLAVKLALSPRKLGALRKRLVRNRGSCALFDTPRLVRDLEQLYLRVARGTLLRDGGAPPRHAGAGLPLVSVLIAAGVNPGDTAAGSKAAARAQSRRAADALEHTLRSALEQNYGHVEIIICDSSGGDIIRDRVAPWLARHPQLRYNRAPGLAPEASLDHCLALALGQYIAVAPPGDILHPDRLARMMQFYQRYPNVGLVACWRQQRDGDGNALPGAPVFGVETAIGGVSLGELLLSAAGTSSTGWCEPGALLLRRDAIGAGFGHYMGQRYRALAGVATALAALPGRDCVYLPQALGSCIRPAPQAHDVHDALERGIESLQLLYGAHAQQLFLADAARFRQVLAARLGALGALLSSQHTALAGLPAPRLEQIQQVLRQGYQLLLSPPRRPRASGDPC